MRRATLPARPARSIGGRRAAILPGRGRRGRAGLLLACWRSSPAPGPSRLLRAPASSPARRRPSAALVAAVDDAALWLAFLVAATARPAASTSPRSPTSCRATCAGTSASPCTRWRCILLVAAIRRDRGVRWYVGPLAGDRRRSISTYHYLVEWFPSLEGGGVRLGDRAVHRRLVPRARLRHAGVHGVVRVPAILVLVVPRPPPTAPRRPRELAASRTIARHRSSWRSSSSSPAIVAVVVTSGGDDDDARRPPATCALPAPTSARSTVERRRRCPQGEAPDDPAIGTTVPTHHRHGLRRRRRSTIAPGDGRADDDRRDGPLVPALQPRGARARRVGASRATCPRGCRSSASAPRP